MGEQLELVPRPPDIARQERQREEKVRRRLAKKSIDQRFAEFHIANPHVFDELLRLARARLAAGATRIGTKALWEEVRASLIAIRNSATRACDDDGAADTKFEESYKLNNDFTALYARMLVRAEPRLEGVIEMRRRKRGE